MNALIKLDHWLFSIINQQFHNDILDALMPFIRNANSWLPLYIFLVILVWKNIPSRTGSWLFFLISLPILTDLVSSWLVKEQFARIRPCNQAYWQDSIRFLLRHRPQSFSFTSSHATTHMALAVFFYLTLANLIPKQWRMFFFLWAFIIGYAQIYVGVHYPLDILGGYILGALLGFGFAKVYHHKFGLL
jgi:undecaprenyl-diphosphatase